MVATSLNIFALGDHAVTIEFGNSIDVSINQKVISLFHQLKAKPFVGLLDLIPAYTSLTAVFDIAVTRPQVPAHLTCFVWVEAYISEFLKANAEQLNANIRKVRVPVCYHPSLAPDLNDLAVHHQLTVNEVIAIHTATPYQVYMLGFLPGFPYMATVSQKIATSRKATPRKQVPAGSVGIAGNQTGIYPFNSPGGWQLIGQTPLKIFNAQLAGPTFFQPGDQVTFYPISLGEFNQQKQHEHPNY